MEIEAKFALATAEDVAFWQTEFKRAGDLLGWHKEQVKPALSMAAYYYDTTDKACYQAGYSLRLRREGEGLVFTVKQDLASSAAQTPSPADQETGLVRRQEWEEVLLDQLPLNFTIQTYESLAWERIKQLSLTDQRLVPLAKILEQTQPVLQGSSCFERLRLDLVRGETRIEWALDQGFFQHPGLADEAFAELELELKSGSSRDLQGLVRQLQKLRPLQVQTWSKQVRALHAPNDLLIVGAGPAGLAAALGAGQKAREEAIKPRILIVDKEAQAGRKILASGNGRCNLSNQYISADKYRSQQTASLAQFIQQIPQKFIRRFCHDLGLAFKYDEAGRAYPQAEEARAVRDLLLARLEDLGVTFALNTEICQISPPAGCGQTYYLQSHEGQIFRAKTLILAPGSPAQPALGGNWTMAQLAHAWQLPYQDFRPALCGLLLDPNSSFSKLSGCRIKAKASLAKGRVISVKVNFYLIRVPFQESPPWIWLII